jgi:MSHA biogenesis protein MshL
MTSKPSALKATLTSLVALSALMPVSACDLAQNQLKMDRATNSEVQDYRDALAPREVSMTEGNGSVGEDNGLELQPYVSDVSETMKAMPLVSISINQSIPLREALFELSKQANYDVELDPRIAGSIIFTARNRPFDVVIDRICEIAGLRYKLDGDTLRIELDTPYSQNYKIDYLGVVRKNKSSVNNSVSLTTGGDGGPTGGSSFSVQSSSDADFWAELDTNLKQILASNASGSYLKTEEDPTISLTASNPIAPPVPPIDESALKEGAVTATVPPQAGASVSSPV